MAAGLATALDAATVVTVTGAEGSPGCQAEISVALQTDAADVAAAEIRVPLPADVVPVDGSLAVNTQRLPDHSVTADMNGSEYVIVVFNTSLRPIAAGDGEAVRFKVQLGENPGRFDLTPRVKLSGSDGSSLATTSTGGTLTVLAPRLEWGETAVDFGRVPLHTTITRSVTATNSGTTPLTISGYTTAVEGLTATLPSGKIEAGESGEVMLSYTPTRRATSVTGRFTPESDAAGRAPFITVTSVPFSRNELHVGSAEGVCDEEVTVNVSMENMEPIVGAEFTLQLPEELEFVEGSLVKASRASALTAESTVDGSRRLRIVLFGLNNQSVTGNEGDLLSFRLKLTGRSGSYALTPEKVILANAGGENMVSDTRSGSVSVTSPSLYGDDEFRIGNIALGGETTFAYRVNNYGSAPLKIERVAFLDEGFECNAALPMTIEPWSEGEVPVTVKNPVMGVFATTMNLYTNDPDNRMKAVAVSGNFYSANELNFKGNYSDGTFKIDAVLKNDAPIVALQLDIVCPAGITTDESLLTLASRAESHSATLANVGDNRYRLIIFSLSNKSFTGNDGTVFTLGFTGENIAGSVVNIENIKLSSEDGVNFTTPDSEVKTEILPVPVTGITVTADSPEIRVGESTQATATVTPSDATYNNVVWATSDPSVATVNEYGTITAVSLGTATITATTDGSEVKGECEIRVVPTPVESISLNYYSLMLSATETVQLTATVLPENATDKSVAWSVSDPEIATVDENGLVTAVAVGTATVTATASSGLTAECVVNVIPTPVESITLNLDNVSLKVDETATLTATVGPETATDKTVTWEVSNPEIATVDDGTITAHSLGTAVVTATAADGSGVSAQCVVNVVATSVEEITLDFGSVELKATETVQLTATVLPENATDKSVAWSVSDPEIATVDENGLVTAVAVGTATVTATASSGLTAECVVNVIPTPVESITLSLDNAIMRLWETVTLTAEVTPADATDRTVVWSSSDNGVADVDSEGIVTATGIGTATITATAADGSGVSATCEIEVTAPLATSITLDRDAIDAIVGDEIALTATVLPSEASEQELRWSVSDETVATVSPLGVVTILSAGNTVVTVETTDGSELSATCTVNATMSGIETIFADRADRVDVYDLGGLLIMRNATRADISTLPAGIYIVNRQKVALNIAK